MGHEKGVEDPGGGRSTFFKLENRLFLNNGQSDPIMPFYNEAQIGLQSTSYGQVVLSRQYNAMIEGITMGGYCSNPWIPYDFNFQPEVTMTGGIWSSNQIQYHGKYKDFRLSTAYSFSGNAGTGRNPPRRKPRSALAGQIMNDAGRAARAMGRNR